MAFEVAPTSGVGPFTVTADLSNKTSFSYGYALRLFISSPLIGSCPDPSSVENPQLTGSAELLDTGVYVTSVAVAVGSCRVYVLRIYDDMENIVDEQFVDVSNI